MIIRTDPERPDPRRLGPAIEALRRDGVIIYPTDTGYAFGCALSSPKGIGDGLCRGWTSPEVGDRSP